MLICAHCGQSFATTAESRRHVCPKPGRLSQASGARLMAAHEKVVEAMRKAMLSANTRHWLADCEALGSAQADFEQMVATLTDSEGL
jgi:predicted  nucleic acid-binding Zn-ribbon protein